MRTIGEKIKQARLDHGMTQMQLAERCNPRLADSAIRKYESGRVIPKQAMLERIAHAMGMSGLELTHYNDERTLEILREKFENIVTPEMENAAAEDQVKTAQINDDVHTEYTGNRYDVFAITSNCLDELASQLKARVPQK